MARDKSPVNVELLREIQSLNFAIIETVLYLNTHPEDRTVLRLHNDYARQYHELVERYQENYGPLYATYEDADYPWQWIDEPWPWDIKY